MTTKNASEQESDVEKLARLAKGVQFAMFTTRRFDDARALRSRPMTLQEADFDGDFWFLASNAGNLARDVRENALVHLTFSQPKGQEYIAADGVAQLSFDREKMKELWSPLYKAWFPKGLDDPELALVKVHVERADYWEAPSSKVVRLYGFAKAMLAGKSADGDLGHHGHVELGA